MAATLVKPVVYDLGNLPEALPDGTHFEIDEGELVVLSPTNRSHGRHVARITFYLYGKLPPEQFEVLSGEVGFILAENPKITLRGTDVAVVNPLEGEPPDGFIREPPILAVEVVSPSNSPEDIEKKRIQYLAAGTREVWIVYPKTKTMHVFKADSQSFVVKENGSFESSVGALIVNANDLFRR